MKRKPIFYLLSETSKFFFPEYLFVEDYIIFNEIFSKYPPVDNSQQKRKLKLYVIYSAIKKYFQDSNQDVKIIYRLLDSENMILKVNNKSFLIKYNSLNSNSLFELEKKFEKLLYNINLEITNKVDINFIVDTICAYI